MTMRQKLVISAFFAALCPTLTQAGYVQCDHIRAGGVSFKLDELSKPVTLDAHLGDTDAGKTTLTLDISLCGPLKTSEKREDSKKKTYCPTGSMICATEMFTPSEGSAFMHNQFSIAGEFPYESRLLDARFEKLSDSEKEEDRNKEGFRGIFSGGLKKTDMGNRKQTAIIEFLCDHKRTGLEGTKDFKPSAAKDDDKDKDKDKDNDKGKDEDKDKDDASLKFVSYTSLNDKEDVLHLTWATKHACEDEADFGNSSAHWGFFTWMLIILFMATASYLVFGSWINYSKNGARGWDLLPHSDSIRDLPYLLRDWARKIIDTFSGGGGIRLGGSRGGYAAV